LDEDLKVSSYQKFGKISGILETSSFFVFPFLFIGDFIDAYFSFKEKKLVGTVNTSAHTGGFFGGLIFYLFVARPLKNKYFKFVWIRELRILLQYFGVLGFVSIFLYQFIVAKRSTAKPACLLLKKPLVTISKETHLPLEPLKAAFECNYRFNSTCHPYFLKLHNMIEAYPEAEKKKTYEIFDQSLSLGYPPKLTLREKREQKQTRKTTTTTTPTRKTTNEQ